MSRKREKYVTIPVFERQAASSARSFTQIEGRFDRNDVVLEKILTKIQGLRSEAREDRQSIAAIAYGTLKLEQRLS